MTAHGSKTVVSPSLRKGMGLRVPEVGVDNGAAPDLRQPLTRGAVDSSCSCAAALHLCDDAITLPPPLDGMGSRRCRPRRPAARSQSVRGG